VEESMVNSRKSGNLLDQDRVVRSTIQKDDVLIVSLGGNDIALHPTFATILNMLSLLYCSTTDCLDRTACGCSLTCDDGCNGWTTGCLSNFLAWPWGYGYFVHLFGTRIQRILNDLTAHQKPRTIVVCMIYYPDETAGNSWADTALSRLGYNQNPRKLQVLIDKIFRDATQRIRIDGSRVVAVPLSAVMDGKNHEDYCARVEPSPQGGQKMAELILNYIAPCPARALS
jgi:lysophospholipase L1-like esterase